MYAVITSNGALVARDFRTHPEALSWTKQFNTPLRVISQNSKEFIKIENQNPRR
jgi:hypothetical protein